METAGLEPLLELLRIPSVSADPAHAGDVGRALEWVAAYVEGCGGSAEIAGGLVVGEVRAATGGGSPTVLVYGHVDVQPPAPLELWETPAFEPTVRDGWLYCRGVADDKGQLWLLLDAVRELAAAGTLPVNVRVLCDAEEEIGGTSAADWVGRDAQRADACVIFDTAMLQGDLPAFYRVVGTRPVLVRSGGSLPIAPALEARGIPFVITGFDVPDGNVHAPNER